MKPVASISIKVKRHFLLVVPIIYSNWIISGVLGDCWFLAAASSLADIQQFFEAICPTDQESGFDAGIFKFRFWRYGEWIEVVVDDYLPTVGGELILNRSNEISEFWPALLEKAYAKIHGCYGALTNGLARHAFLDMTGSLIENFNLEDAPEDLFEQLHHDFQLMAMMTCSTAGEDEGGTNEDGLLHSHTYSITKVFYLELEDETYKLIRIRNPWGNCQIWTGAWSDTDDMIKNLPDDVKEKYDIVIDECDGEFHMSVEDMRQRFKSITVCHVLNDHYESLGLDRIGDSVSHLFYRHMF